MNLKSNFSLLLAAAIWGFAFVAQKAGLDYVGPFTFNGVRFALGSLSLLPLLLFFKDDCQTSIRNTDITYKASYGGLLVGSILFIAASLQQIGLLYTTAGKAAFITCLYIILVPMTGIFLKRHINITTWLGTILATTGLYFLCIKESFSISYGDLLELAGAFFWAIHILLIDRYSQKIEVLKLAAFQFATCSILSFGAAILLETISLGGILQASIPILYGGICSVGVAYTLQIVGQKNATPASAAIILSLETVFAALGGFFLLDENLDSHEIWGCVLTFAGMLVSQVNSQKDERETPSLIS